MIFTDKELELKKIIIKGNVLYIKHPGMYEPFLSVIQKVTESTIYISVSEAFVRNGVLKGDCVVCQLLEGDYEYVIQGIIEEVVQSSSKTVCLTMEKVSKYKNNRVFKRYSVNFKADVNVAGSTNCITAVVKNISIIGVGIESHEFIHIKSIVSLQINTFICNEALELKARIVRGMKNENVYEYGLEIIDINEVNKDILDKLMFYLNTSENTFIEDLIK